MGRVSSPPTFGPVVLWLLGAALLMGGLFVVPGSVASSQSDPDAGSDPPAQKQPGGPATETPFLTATSTSTVAPTRTLRPTYTPTPTYTPCPIQFTDVPPGSTFYEYVRCLACRGIVNGYPDGTFRPNNWVTRGQIAKIMSNAVRFNEPVPVDQQSFEDVPPGSTFWVYAERLAVRGDMDGYPCGNPGEPCVPPGNRPYFRPNGHANRGQLAKITSNVAGLASACNPTHQFFQDVPPNNPYWCYVERLGLFNVLNGYPCGGPGEPCVPPLNLPYFRPYNNTTRGQVSALAARFFYPQCVTPVRSEKQVGPGGKK